MLVRGKLCRRCRGSGALCRPKIKPTGSRCIPCRDCSGTGARFLCIATLRARPSLGDQGKEERE